MYKLNGNTITKQQADDTASFYDMSTEDYAAKNNWVLDEGGPKDKPGKPKGSAKKTAVVGPKPATSSGESSSEDISQGLPGVELALETENNVGVIGAEIIQARADVTPASVADRIGMAYFSLENKDGMLSVKTTNEITTDPSLNRGFSQGQGVDSRVLKIAAF